MDFARDGHAIAQFGEVVDHAFHVFARLGMVPDGTGAHWVQSRVNGCACGNAHRLGGEQVREKHALTREPVDVGGAHVLAPVTAQLMGVQIVSHEDEEVGPGGA